MIVIADSGNWDIGVPALTTSLRGIVNCFVEVRTLDHAVHSGMFGGAVPDALTALVRLLATLHDDAGDVAVDGPGRPAGARRSTTRRTGSAPRPGMLDGVAAHRHRPDRRPDLDQAGASRCSASTRRATGEAPNALVPVGQGQAQRAARARRRPEAGVRARCSAHLEKHAPWGAQVDA